MNPANQNISLLLAKLEREIVPVSTVLAVSSTAPQLAPSSTIAHVEPIPSKEPIEIDMFVRKLSILMQNSLHTDRSLNTGELGRRADNLDRAIEVAAGAVDATASPTVSLATNAARVGVGAVRNLYTDLVASKTIEFGSEDIGEVCRKAAEMVVQRYKDQIIKLDTSGIDAFATYCHRNAIEKLHSLIKEPVKNFCLWLIGSADSRNFLPEDKLFFAFITPHEQGPTLRTKNGMKFGESWRADELIQLCGREYMGIKYTLRKGSLHERYGFCVCNDKKEIEKLQPLKLQEKKD